MFYLIEIATGDAKIAARSIFTYDNEKDAIANFHSRLGMAMKSDLYTTDLCMVIDENGTVLKREKYANSI